jgi:hypothetical protein
LSFWAIATSIWITGAVVVFCYVLTGRLAAWRLYRTTQSVQKPWLKQAQHLLRELQTHKDLYLVESARVSVPLVFAR